MAENSKIEWCDSTTNLWHGCSKRHTGCLNCYAEAISKHYSKVNLWGENAERKLIKSAFPDLDKYQKQAKREGKKLKIFIGSMMDIFEDSKPLLNGDVFVPETDYLRHRLFSNITAGRYQNLIFLFLTKRPENIVHMIPNDWINNTPKNVWFGTSVSNQETLEYAESLRLVSDTNLFLSIEPQVGAIDYLILNGIDWVIQGGESGHHKRPFDIDWAYRMKDICKEQNIPYFFKQIDKVKPIPNDLMIREFPNF